MSCRSGRIATANGGRSESPRSSSSETSRPVDPAVVELELAIPEPEVVRIVKQDGHSCGEARDPPSHRRAGPDACRREIHVLSDRPHGKEDEEQDGGRKRQGPYWPRDPVLDP